MIVFGKDKLKPNEKNSLAELKNVHLYYFENLHAKCYFNEASMVITSMNIYEFSEKNNREMGVLIDRENDKDLFEKAMEEVKSIINSSEIYENTKIQRKFAAKQAQNDRGGLASLTPAMGYCLRCERRIPFDPTRPYCQDCFTVWAFYGNRQFEENVCHSCGEFEFSTMDRPLCYECFKKLKIEAGGFSNPSF